MPHEYNIILHKSIIQLRMKHKQKLNDIHPANPGYRPGTYPLIEEGAEEERQNKLDILYFVVASFTWLLRASCKNRSYLRIKTTMIFRQVCAVLTFNKDWA